MRATLWAASLTVTSAVVVLVTTAASAQPPAAPGPQTGVTSKPVAKPVAKPVDKVGFARVVPDWPTWLTITLVDRVRLESVRLPARTGAEYDGYALNRFRLTTAVKATPWLQFTVQVQDSRAWEYAVFPVPTSMRNLFNLRIAAVEFAKKAARGVSAIVGRQELTFGDGRLMASSDWGNVSRTYDGVRLAAYRPGVKVEAFGAAPVDIATDGIWKSKVGERVYGGWLTLDKVKPLGYVDVYTIAKFNATSTGETGTKGDQAIYTIGVRAGGPVGKSVAWEADTAGQRGHSAADGILGFATHEGISWTIGKSAMKPKLGVEYNYASGDTNPKDGIKHTFDQLYASTHAKWGLGDQIGWRNVHHVAAKFEMSPIESLKINAALNRLFLATVNDAWYGVSGLRVVVNRQATSRDVGWEPDVFATYAVTKNISVAAGVAVLIGGDFVTQSTDASRNWTPYLMWTGRF